MNRNEQISKAADDYEGVERDGFIRGAHWADEYMADHNWQKLFFEGHEHKVCLTALRRFHEMEEKLENGIIVYTHPDSEGKLFEWSMDAFPGHTHRGLVVCIIKTGSQPV